MSATVALPITPRFKVGDVLVAENGATLTIREVLTTKYGYELSNSKGVLRQCNFDILHEEVFLEEFWTLREPPPPTAFKPPVRKIEL